MFTVSRALRAIDRICGLVAGCVCRASVCVPAVVCLLHIIRKSSRIVLGLLPYGFQQMNVSSIRSSTISSEIVDDVNDTYEEIEDARTPVLVNTEEKPLRPVNQFFNSAI
uniref:Secreted protein n=1 Tax=Angiostrongylus cantonensis TaxID=6313 RepID=A0A0K0CTH4_ANGCA